MVCKVILWGKEKIKLFEKNLEENLEDNKIEVFLQSQFRDNKGRPVRLGVRTPGFHPGSRGSNPLRATLKIKDIKEKKWQIISQL